MLQTFTQNNRLKFGSSFVGHPVHLLSVLPQNYETLVRNKIFLMQVAYWSYTVTRWMSVVSFTLLPLYLSTALRTLVSIASRSHRIRAAARTY